MGLIMMKKQRQLRWENTYIRSKFAKALDVSGVFKVLAVGGTSDAADELDRI